jgi:hypothetical protein
MSNSEYTAEMAATGGFDPDAEAILITPPLERVLKMLEDITKKLEVIQKTLEDILKSTRDFTKVLEELNAG